MGAMNIAPGDLDAQYERASRTWPFIAQVEAAYKLPRMLLFAVGSRETNLQNEYGDYGLRRGKPGPLPGGAWAAGVWQLDAASHVIPHGFPGDVRAQANTAAGMLAALRNTFETWAAAVAAYNAGAGTIRYNLAHELPVDTGTAGGDYSADVLARMTYLQDAYPEAPTISEDDDVKPYLVRQPSGSVWVVRVDLSSRTHVVDPADLALLEHTGNYTPLRMSDAQLAVVPVAHA